MEMLKQGKVLAVPESAIIDTGNQKVVYRETTPGVYEGVSVTLGPRMINPDGAPFYPILIGINSGDRVVSVGSFLVDAETRLNPAAGSIYFGSSSGSKTASTGTSNVRPSTPEDPLAKIESALATLSPEDRAPVRCAKILPVARQCFGSDGSAAESNDRGPAGVFMLQWLRKECVGTPAANAGQSCRVEKRDRRGSCR